MLTDAAIRATVRARRESSGDRNPELARAGSGTGSHAAVRENYEVMIMKNMSRLQTWILAMSLLLGGVVSIVVFGHRHGRATESDKAAIRTVIEAAYPAEVEACLYGNHASIQEHKDVLLAYLSDATRTPSELSTRTARENEMFPTVNPANIATAVAEERALATRDPSVVPGYKLAAITGFVNPTPHWRAADSMLDERWRSIDTCQSAYESSNAGQMAHAFQVTGYDYQDISVKGNFADVDVLIEGWTEWLPDGAGRSTGTDHYKFRLEKSGGDWKIVNEGVTTPLRSWSQEP